MKKSLLNQGVNVVAFEKNNIKFAATIAWSMQVDYDKILLLMGSQSDTGNNIEKGQIIGVSALAKNQIEISEKIGQNHSKTTDKLIGINYVEEKIDGHQETAITIVDAANQMVVEVVDVIHLKEIEEDNLIYGKVLKTKNTDKEYLSMSDF